jgi:ParB family chromosome partitioning protein
MNSTSWFHPVPLSAIDFEDRTYSLTLFEDHPSEMLLASIKRFGILHPPILRQVDDNSYCIIVGRKRITATQHLAPAAPIFCRIIPVDIEITAIFSLLLEEAETGIPLSIVEQIVFFEKLLLISPMEEAIPMLEQLGYKPQIHILKNLLKLRSLNESVLQALHHGTIHIKSARKLLNLSETDQKMIVQLITSLHLGGSKQQKLIDLCIELNMRKNVPLKTILADFPSADELGQPMNIPQHGAALLSWLHNECFPQFSQAENNFKRQVARLNLPSTMHISHTPAFENKEITLSLCFPDWRSLDKALGGINKLIQKK